MVANPPGTSSFNIRLPNELWDVIDYAHEHPTESRSVVLTRIVREWAAQRDAFKPSFVKPGSDRL